MTWQQSSNALANSALCCLVSEERRAEFALRQDLEEILDTEHLLKDVSGKQGRIYRVLRAMR